MLQNKVVVVIGSEGFLGKKIVDTLKLNNALVIRSDIKHSEKNCDITKKEEIVSLINYTLEKFEKIDCVINTSYPRNENYGKKFEEVEYKDFCENVNLHLGGYFLVMQTFAEFFKNHGGGNIINIASIYGVMPPRFEIYENTDMTMPVEYNAVKHAVISLTKYTAKYYKGKNIRVNCISPGGLLNNQPKEFLEKYNHYGLSKGMLNPEDVTGTVLFLCSDLSRYINGQNIIVDDGWSL